MLRKKEEGRRDRGRDRERNEKEKGGGRQERKKRMNLTPPITPSTKINTRCLTGLNMMLKLGSIYKNV